MFKSFEAIMEIPMFSKALYSSAEIRIALFFQTTVSMKVCI